MLRSGDLAPSTQIWRAFLIWCLPIESLCRLSPRPSRFSEHPAYGLSV
ncbi:unnamed protein product, partial [Mycena citricolor]